MQCVVLAGGLGTRMSSWTTSMPKALIPVCGEPFLRHQLRLVAAAGVDDVVVLTGYRAEMIDAEIACASHLGVRVRCIPDGPDLLGTGGAVRRAVGLDVLDDVFLLTYGDSYLTIDHRAVFEAFDVARFGALMTVLHNDDDERERSNAAYADGKVRLYRKDVARPAELGMHHVDYGLSVLSATSVLAGIQPEERADLSVLFEALSFEGRLQGFETDLRFHEVGSQRGLAELEAFLAHSPEEATAC